MGGALLIPGVVLAMLATANTAHVHGGFLLNKELDTLKHMTMYVSSVLHRTLSVRINSERVWLFRSEERDQHEIKTCGDDGSNEINRRREVRM